MLRSRCRSLHSCAAQYRRSRRIQVRCRWQRSGRSASLQPSPPGPRWWRARQGEPLGLTPHLSRSSRNISSSCRRNNSGRPPANPAICASSATVAPVVVGAAGGAPWGAGRRDSHISATVGRGKGTRGPARLPWPASFLPSPGSRGGPAECNLRHATPPVSPQRLRCAG